MKKNWCTPINPQKSSCYGLKIIHIRTLITKKISCGSKIPLPSPHNFSNGPSLRPLHQYGRGQGSNSGKPWIFSGFLFATAQVAYFAVMLFLLSRSSNIWNSYIQHFTMLATLCCEVCESIWAWPVAIRDLQLKLGQNETFGSRSTNKHCKLCLHFFL